MAHGGDVLGLFMLLATFATVALCSVCSGATWRTARPPREGNAHVVVHAARDVDEHLETFLEMARRHADGASLPGFVEQEFRNFLTCGVLAHGFARLRCTSFSVERLVPFSCTGRGFCPDRCMTESAARLVDEVLPRVPVRQWVLSLPHRLRYLQAWDHGLARGPRRARVCSWVSSVTARTDTEWRIALGPCAGARVWRRDPACPIGRSGNVRPGDCDRDTDGPSDRSVPSDAPGADGSGCGSASAWRFASAFDGGRHITGPEGR